MESTLKQIKISRILHAGYILECSNAKIAFDPIFENPFSQNCHAFPEAQFNHSAINRLQLDAVFISHHHDDHCSLESLNHLNKSTPIYMYCIYEELFDWIKELGFTQVYPLRLDQPISVGDFQITPRRALDEDVDSIFEITAYNLKILNVVDSWIDPNTIQTLSQSSPWDLVMWPFQTMRELEVLSPRRGANAPAELPPEWFEQLTILKPRYVIASSCQFLLEDWSWYNQAFFPITYKKFKEDIEAEVPTTQVIRLDPSQSVLLSKAALKSTDTLTWIHSPDAGKERDYIFAPQITPPSTAQIATHFSELTAHQKTLVIDYCQDQMLDKYKALSTTSDDYFDQERLWKLSLYNHLGTAEDFYYLVKKNQIAKSTQNLSVDIAWTTEIPLTKLYRAIAHGETLTSLYMRINGNAFAPHIEEQLQNVDILEDPLIRCLFTGVFGAYQKAQLHKIKQLSERLSPDDRFSH